MVDTCKHWQAVIAERALTNEPPVDLDLDAHLASCADCTTVVVEFRVLTAALAHTTAASKSPAPTIVPPGLDSRITAQLRRARAQRRSRRAAIAISGAAAAAVLLIVALTSIHSTTPPPPGERVGLVAGDVRGDARLETRAWGTQIHLAGTGFTPGQQYNVWLERADGTHIPSGTFTGVRNARITVILASALPSAQATAIGVSTPNGDLVVRSPLN